MKGKMFTTAGLVLAALCGGAAWAAEEEEQLPLYLFADLSGDNETKGGDADGFGDFSGVLKFKEGQFCYQLTAGDIGDVTGAHIHAGVAGADGDVIFPISLTAKGEEKCLDADAKLLGRIAKEPGAFYVNVHTADHPAGAIRGQLES